MDTKRKVESLILRVKLLQSDLEILIEEAQEQGFDTSDLEAFALQRFKGLAALRKLEAEVAK